MTGAQTDRHLAYYTVIAEQKTGFWIDLPVDTGQRVSRTKWLSLMKEDPEHFQMATLVSEDPSANSMKGEVVVECAVFVTWSDEMLQ